MTSTEFVEGFYKEKEDLLKLYSDNEQETEVGNLIKTLDLKDDKKETLMKIIDNALTDTLYTVLLGLDGAASIGDRQEMYKLLDENGNELTGGEIEVNAWEFFHSKEK
jgi:hypothetical protein